MAREVVAARNHPVVVRVYSPEMYSLVLGPAQETVGPSHLKPNRHWREWYQSQAQADKPAAGCQALGCEVLDQVVEHSERRWDRAVRLPIHRVALPQRHYEHH